MYMLSQTIKQFERLWVKHYVRIPHKVSCTDKKTDKDRDKFHSQEAKKYVKNRLSGAVYRSHVMQ
jgi:hypothetical protein